MTSLTHQPLPVAAHTLSAILLTGVLVAAPLTTSAFANPSDAASTAPPGLASAALPVLPTTDPPGPASTTLTGTSPAELGGAPGSAGAQRLGDRTGSAPELESSQEGSWLLGRPVDSVLGPGQWFTTEEGRTWYGAYRTFPDTFAYCVDAGLKTPHPRHFDKDGEGETIDAAHSAWALSTHSRSDSAPVQAALSAIVRLDDTIPHRHVIEPGHPADLGHEFEEAAAKLSTISDDADRFAGPYTLSVDIRVRTLQAYDGKAGPPLIRADDPSRATTAAHTSADATAPQLRTDPRENSQELPFFTGGPLLRGFPLEAVVSLTSASGHQMSGHRVRLSSAGTQPWDESFIVGDEPTVVSLGALSEDVVAIDAIASDLPATSVVIHRPRGLGSDNVQAVVTAGEPTTVTQQAVYERGPHSGSDPETETDAGSDSDVDTDSGSDPGSGPDPGSDPESDPGSSPDTEQSSDPDSDAESGTEVPNPIGPTPEAPRDDATEDTADDAVSPPPTALPLPLPTASPDQPQPSAEPAPETATASPKPHPLPSETALVVPAPTASTPGTPPPPPQNSPEPTVPESLPRTGTNSTMAIGLAITLIAVGAGALTVTRRN